MNSSKRVNFVTPLVFLFLFCAGIAVLFVVLASADKSRKSEVYRTYAVETHKYIDENKEDLSVLFTLLRQNNPPCVEDVVEPPFCPRPTNQEQINKLTQNLKDWSSTAFLVESKYDEGISMTRLSGDTKSFYVYPPEKQLRVKRLLSGEVEEIAWDDYAYEFPGKEVIIPVKDSSGKVVGAIIRGVIEENSL